MCLIAFLGYEDDTTTNNNLNSHVASNNTLLLSLYLSTCIYTRMYNVMLNPEKNNLPKKRCGSDERTEANKETVNH